CTHPVGQAVIDRPHLKVHALHGTEGLLDLTEALVIAHDVIAAHALLRYRGADHVDAVEAGFLRHPCVVDRVPKRRVTHFQIKVLADLVAVQHLAHAQAAAGLALQTPRGNPLADRLAESTRGRPRRAAV